MNVGHMRERVILIGAPRPLVGIYATRDDVDSAPLALVLLNSGVIHRVGSCRLTVNIARSVTSGLGIPTLRFDYSGIGDSEPRRTTKDRDQLAVEEIIEVLDFLEKAHGINRFVLYGLCSGARDAFRAATIDPRVIGIAQVDGCAYRNAKYYLTHYRERVLDVGHWNRFLFKSLPEHLKKVLNRSEKQEVADMFVQEWEPYPPRQSVARDYSMLAQRGVQFYVLYTGSWVEDYNYEAQFFDMFPEVEFGDSVTLKYRRDTDHIHSDLADQELLVRELGGWVGNII